MEFKVIPWTWRDGRVRMEMRLVHFAGDDGIMTTHLAHRARFESACGTSYWNKAHGEGLGKTEGIDCPECIRILQSLTFTCEYNGAVQEVKS